jgi:hypothetical protein
MTFLLKGHNSIGTKKRSNITFFLLLATFAIAAGLNSFLPQGEVASQIPQSQIPKWLIASASVAGTVVIYGILGFIDLTLWRRICFPNILIRDQDLVYSTLQQLKILIYKR